MSDETAPTGDDNQNVADIEAARVARATEEVEPNLKGTGGAKAGKTRKAAGGTKKAGATKKAATKKAATKKTGGTSVARRPSTVPKEGTRKDAFDGKEYPITNFPTVRQADGSYIRGDVTRANLPAWREKRKAERIAAKEAAAKAKAEAKAAKEKEAAAKG